jgi:hypothetical protein
MHLTYDAANGNGREAARIYGEPFPNRQQPHHLSFAAKHNIFNNMENLSGL